jgi:hypothetical protein
MSELKSQNRNLTEAQLLGFAYDFGVTVTTALLKIFKMADVKRGGNAYHNRTG